MARQGSSRRPFSYYRSIVKKEADYGFDQTTILAAGAAAAATTAVPRLFPQQSDKTGTGKFYERGPVRIYYEEAGSGFPLLLLPGGGLNSTISFFTRNSPFDAIEESNGQDRFMTADLRNASSGQSTGPVEVDRPWESYADDQLGLMDYMGIDQFMVMGFCIGGPFIWSLLKRAPGRIPAAVLAQPVGLYLRFRGTTCWGQRRCSGGEAARGRGLTEPQEQSPRKPMPNTCAVSAIRLPSTAPARNTAPVPESTWNTMRPIGIRRSPAPFCRCGPSLEIGLRRSAMP